MNNKLDTSTFSTFRDGINPRVTNLENNKLDTSAFNAFKSGDFTTWQTKVNNKLDTSTFSTFRDGINPRVTNLENNKLNKTDFTTFQSTVNGQITNLTNTKLNTATFNKFNTNLTGLVNQVLGTTFTVAQMQGTLPAYNYTGIKYFRANSTGTDASATGTDAVAIGPVAQATEVDTVAIGHEARASKAAAIAVGKKSYSNADNGIAVGNDSTVTAGATSAVALGFHARAGSNNNGDVTYDGANTFVPNDGASAVAIGDHAISRGKQNIAIGKNALTTNKDAANAFSQDSVAIGSGAETIAASSAIAFGKGARVGVRGSSVGADSAIAMGDGAQATGLDATAIGHSAQAGKSGLAAGSSVQAVGEGDVALGRLTTAAGGSSVAIGENAKALQWKTISIGLNAGEGQAADVTRTKHSNINIGVLSGKSAEGQHNIFIGSESGHNTKGKASVAIGLQAGTNTSAGSTPEAMVENVSIGNNANYRNDKTSSVTKATALGAQTFAENMATAVGYGARSEKTRSLAVGNMSVANGEESTAIGASAQASGVSVALGSNSIAKNKTAQGVYTGMQSESVVSVGNDTLTTPLYRRLVNVADGADEQDAVTVKQLKTLETKVTQTIAVANNTAASVAGAVLYDTTDGDNDPTTNSVTFKDSVGSSPKLTRLQGVAAGKNDTDAVNFKQLKSEIAQNSQHYFSVNDDKETGIANYDNTGAKGKRSTAIGTSSITYSNNSVALGNEVTNYDEGGIAIGTEYVGSDALDDNKKTDGKTTVSKQSQNYKYGIALGAGTNAQGNNSIAIGSLAATSTDDIAHGDPDRAIAIGYYAVSSAAKANAIGDRARANSLKSNAFGSQAEALNESANAFGSVAKASGKNSIAMGTHQEVTGENSGSIGYAGGFTNTTVGSKLSGTYDLNATKVAGSGTYSIGNTNSKITSNESGVFGNNNFVQGKENIRVMGNSNIITKNNQDLTGGGAAVTPTLKNVYVTGHGNKIDTGKKPLEESKNIFVMGAENAIGDVQKDETLKISDSYVIGTNNKINQSGKDYFILGNNVDAKLQNSVYLGANTAFVSDPKFSAKEKYKTKTDGNTALSDYEDLLVNKYTGREVVGVATIGSNSQQRRLQGVGAGLVGPESTDAINGSQLYAHTRPVGFVADNTDGLAGKDLDKLVVDEAGITNMVKRSAGQAIKLNGGADKTKLSDNNIGTLVVNKDNKTNQIDIKLAKELKDLTSAEFKDGTNTTTINGKGVSITNGPSMTTAGINAGNQKITNVANGVADADAVNVSQLKAARTVVKSDDHSVLVQESENGLTKTYDVSVAMPVVYTKADGTKVYKLADGTFNTNANGGAATKVEAADVIASMHNAAGSTTTAIALANVASSIQNKAGANFAEKLNAANTANPNNAVNVSDLKLTKDSITSSTQGGGFGLKDQDDAEVKQDLGTTVKVKGDANVYTKVVTDGTGKALEVGLKDTVTLGKAGTDGKDGKIGVNGKDGSAVVINGKDGSIGLNGANGANGLTIKSANGKDGVDGANGANGKTRIVYETPNGGKEEVATLKDGLVFTGNNSTVLNKHKLNSTVNVVGDSTAAELNGFVSATGNLNVVADGTDKLTVQMSKNLKNLNSVTMVNETDPDKSVKLNVTDKGELNVGGDKADGNQVTGVKSSISDKLGAGDKFADKLNKAATDNPTNAVNVSDLKQTRDSITTSDLGGGFGLKDQDDAEVKQDLGTTVKVKGDANVYTKVVTDGTGKALEVGLKDTVTLGKAGTDGKDGKIGVNGKDGSAVVINGKDGSIGLNGKDGKDGLTMKSAQGKPGVDGKDGETKTRIVYELKDKDGNPVKDADGKVVKEEVATLNDGLKFGANAGTVHNAKLNTQVDVKGAVTNTDWNKFDAGKNIMTNIDGNTITVGLAKDLDVNSVTTGDTKVENSGITIKNGSEQSKTVSLTKTGLNNGGNQVVNMDSGLKDSQGNKVTLTEATGDVLNNGVNVGDLKETVNKLIGPSDIGGFGLKDKAGNEFKQSLGTTAQITGDKNINTKVVDVLDAQGQATGKKALEVGLNPEVELGKKGNDGVDGKLTVNGKDGSSVVVDGSNGSIGLNGKDGKDGLTMKSEVGEAGLDQNNATDPNKPDDKGSKTRLVYEHVLKDKDGNPQKGQDGKPVTVKEQVATLNDGLVFAGNNTDKENKHKLNSKVNIVGDSTAEQLKDFKSATGNLNVVADGNNKLTVQMSKNLKNLNSVTLENPTDAKKSVTLTVTDKGELNVGGDKAEGNQVTGVKSSITDKAGATFADKLKNAADKDNGNPNNAVNVGDLYNVFSGESGGGFGLKDKAGNEFKQDLGTTAQITGDKNINTKVVDVLDAQGQATGKKALEVGLNPEIELGEKAVPGVNGQPGKDGVDGKIGVNGKDGSAVVINGKDGSIGLNGKDGKDGLTMKSAQGKPGVDGKDGETKTRIVYETKDKDGKPVTEEVATLNDGLKFGDNSGNVHNAKLNSQVNVKGAETNKDWGKFDGGKNIMTQIKGNTITVGLANDINVNSVTTNKVTVGDTTITTDGVTINNGPSMTKSGGINANNTTIKNVAPGVNSTDAVNVSQLRQVQGNINRADKHLRAGIAGANAAAGLPQAYLPGKSMVAVSAGTYRGEGAVALGMSRISDNGKVVVKITGNSDTRGNLGASLGAGYQW